MSSSFARLRAHVLTHPELLESLVAAETALDFQAALERLALGPELRVSADELEQALRAAWREHLERWLR